MADNQQRFLDAHRRIERQLRSLARNHEPAARFATLLDAAERERVIVRRHRRRIEALHQLRNVLVHQGWDNGQAIADPLPAVLLQIERIADDIERPPALPAGVLCDLRCFDVSDDLGEVLAFMREQLFSQVPITEGGSFKGLLTTNTIARWLAANVGEGLVETRGIPVSALLPHGEQAMDGWRFARAQDDCAQVLALLEDLSRPLRVVLLTDSGRADARLRGIVTMADVPMLNARLMAPA